MSGFIVVAFAGLLMQQADPHPSTLRPYQPPAIRPFEAPSSFGREEAQGDAEADTTRRPLEAPVAVDDYVKSYEHSPSDSEIAYDQGVASAEIRADQSAGPLDGDWRLTDADGHPLFDMVLRDSGDGSTVEGAYRGARAPEAGLAIAGDTPGMWRLGDAVLTLERGADGWRGMLAAEGRSRPVRLVRP